MIRILITLPPQHKCLHIPIEKRLNKVHLSSVTITYMVEMQSISLQQIFTFLAVMGLLVGG
jgi:hypothetical protein